MQIWAEPENRLCPFVYSQILYQFLAFTQNLKRSPPFLRSYFHCFFSSFLILFLPFLWLFLRSYLHRFFGSFLDLIFTVFWGSFLDLIFTVFLALSQILSSLFPWLYFLLFRLPSLYL